ncbi:hypothetical protein JCM6882_008586 [Rhodosporidiobolus microsporus]
MACFEDLPQELVEWIVELAAPSFSPSRWKERDRALKTLCLTSKTMLPHARRLLRRDIAISRSATFSKVLTASGGELGPSLPLSPNLSISHCSTLTVYGGGADDWKWPRWFAQRWTPSSGTVEDQLITELCDRLRPKTLAVKGIGLASFPTTFLASVQTLLLDVCDEPMLALKNFSNLTRLALYDSCKQGSLEALIHLPHLVSLALGVNLRLSPSSAEKHPFKALSRPYAFQFSPSASVVVFDTFFSSSLATNPSSFPPALRVLRLTPEPRRYYYQPPVLAAPYPVLSSMLALEPFQHLEELHLVSFPRISDTGKAVEAWCNASNIRLFVEDPDDLSESFDPSFWRFLDGVKDRLGLNV